MIASMASPCFFKYMLSMKLLLLMLSKEAPKAKLWPSMTQVILMPLMPSRQSSR